MMVRWWWFGPSVTKPELEREMRVDEGGRHRRLRSPGDLSARSRDPGNFKNYPYLSAEYLEALRFTGEKAKELGLRMDLTLGSGWPYGGPHISVAEASGRLRVVRGPSDDAASHARRGREAHHPNPPGLRDALTSSRATPARRSSVRP